MNYVDLCLDKAYKKQNDRKKKLEGRLQKRVKNFPYSKEKENKRLARTLHGIFTYSEVLKLVEIPYLAVLIRDGIIPKNRHTNISGRVYYIDQVTCLIKAKQYASIRVLNNFTIDVKKFHEYIDKHWKWESEDAKQYAISQGYKVYREDHHCFENDVGADN